MLKVLPVWQPADTPESGLHAWPGGYNHKLDEFSPHCALGLLSILYWAFFVCHWAHYFLYVRVQDRMPFFVLLWSNKWLAPLSKPSTYTGSVPLLAENFTDVVSQLVLATSELLRARKDLPSTGFCSFRKFYCILVSCVEVLQRHLVRLRS